MTKPSAFEEELASVINRHCQEMPSDTPDYILAKFLRDCLEAWNAGMQAREGWYGRVPPGKEKRE